MRIELTGNEPIALGWSGYRRPSSARKRHPAAELPACGAASITMALWSDPGTVTTRKASTSSPDTKAWSIRSNRGEPDHGPQVRRGRTPAVSATATAASVSWDAIRR